jgi:hypothetical protein
LKKKNYLNNKDILKQIHLSKNTFNSYSELHYHQYDIILHDLSEINSTTINEAIKNKAKRLSTEEYERRKGLGEKVKQAECEYSASRITKEELIFRVMTFDHIPFEPGRKKNPKTTADFRIKLNFPPFQHWKYNDQERLICVGKSHWNGHVENGEFSKTKGMATNTLALMWMKLCERYATRGNVRGYCVDTDTEALTNRGWLGIKEINENDQILSYTNGDLKWSKIKSIYRGDYNGLMHKMTLQGFDSLVTPGHKFVTERGLVKAEHLKETDKLVLLGNAVVDVDPSMYTDEFVELIGWIVTDGCYQKGRNNKFGCISIYQNKGIYADRIRDCLTTLNYKFSENKEKNICFRISAASSRNVESIFKEKNLNMKFIMSLTSTQRQLLIETMIDSDGWRTNGYKRYCQKDPAHVNLFQAVCAISGIRSNSHLVDSVSFGKPVAYHNINLFTEKKNTTRVECVNFHGGKNNGRSGQLGRGKESHPNYPTTQYNGKVWCPETEYGSFVARRGGGVFLTGNTYNDEMRGQAIMQLAQIGLQFDESKSDNPFAYYTASVKNSFVRIINIEKKNQNIRDDILEMNDLNPSYTRQYASEWQTELKRFSDTKDPAAPEKTDK